ncbi:MAG: O-antigen ligase family protein [Gemmataceae bacterium]
MYGSAITILIAFGGAAVGLFRPYIGFLAYVCLGLLGAEDLWGHALPSLSYSKVIAGGMLLGWAFHGFGSWRFGKAWGIVLALLGLMLWATLSAAAARNEDAAWAFIDDQSKIVLPFLVGITTLDSTAKLKQLVWTIVLTQGLVAFEMNLSYFQGFNRVQELGFRGMDNNTFAISMTTCAGMTFFLGLTAEKWWQKLLALGIGLLILHVILMSFSRGAMLGLIVTTGVAFVLIPKRPWYYLVLLAALLIGVRLAGPEVQARLKSTFADDANRDGSAQSRIDLWQDCLDSMAKNPLLGLGPRHWPLVAHEYGWPRGKEAHSTWMQTGAELGIVGLAWLVLFYVLCFAQLSALILSRREIEPVHRDLARQVIAALAGFLVSAQFVSAISLDVPYFMVMIGAGILKLTSQPMRDRTAFVRVAPGLASRFPCVAQPT